MRCSVGCLCRALVVVAVVSLLSGAAPSDPMCARPNGAAAWTTTWAAAPAAAVPGVGQGYAGHTFRNVVHPTVSGRRVRVHLSNRFGTAPLLLGHVTVALSAHTGGRGDGLVDRSDGAARPGTVRHAVFGGRRVVTVPAGAQVITDPVDLTVTADEDLLVTVWTPEPSGTVTYHPAAQQDSFVARDGADHAGDEGAAKFTGTSRMWHYVNAVDVAGGPGTVVALGDSITDGVSSTWGANRRWTDHLARRLDAQQCVPRYGVANAGISGNRILLDGSAPQPDPFSVFGRNALARLGWDVLDRSGARTVIVFEGINDIQQAPQQSDPERIIAGLGQLIEQSRARGLRVVGATILPWQGWVTWTPQREATRQAVNAWIRTGGAFDAVVDLDAATRDPAHPLRLLPLYDSGDHLHPNDAGNAAIADAVALSEL